MLSHRSDVTPTQYRSPMVRMGFKTEFSVSSGLLSTKIPSAVPDHVEAFERRRLRLIAVIGRDENGEIIRAAAGMEARDRELHRGNCAGLCRDE